MIDNTQFEPFLAELKRLVHQHIIPRYSWYEKHTIGPRICFRISGLIVVIGRPQATCLGCCLAHSRRPLQPQHLL
jgi:hypothetical protein